MATRASKRSRTEDAPPAALLDSAQTAELAHLARGLAELAGGAAQCRTMLLFAAKRLLQWGHL